VACAVAASALDRAVLKNADVLLTADCVPVVCANFHKNFHKENALLIVCLKPDATGPFLDKLTAMIQQSQICSLMVMQQKVPCRTSLVMLARRAVKAAAGMSRWRRSTSVSAVREKPIGLLALRCLQRGRRITPAPYIGIQMGRRRINS
jgi:hypothetical protein